MTATERGVARRLAGPGSRADCREPRECRGTNLVALSGEGPWPGDGPAAAPAAAQSHGEHGKTHATLIRALFLGDRYEGTSAQPPVTVLHRVAAEIIRCCGVSPVKAYRWAWGWTLDEAIQALHDMCAAQDLGSHALSPRSWQMWEAGRTTSDRYRDLLCRLFQTNGLALGFTPDYTPRVLDAGAADRHVTITSSPIDDPNWRRSVDDRLSNIDACLAAVQAAIAGLHTCQDRPRHQPDRGSSHARHPDHGERRVDTFDDRRRRPEP